MTDFEYGQILAHIVSEGRAFDAIRDLFDTIKRRDELKDAVVSEMKAERKTIKKICAGNTSNKNKVETIASLVE